MAEPAPGRLVLTPADCKVGQRRALRSPWWLLIAAVSIAHWLVLSQVAENRFDWQSQSAMPRRIAVEFIRELAQSAAASPAPLGVAPRRPAAAQRAAAVASAASAAESAPAAAEAITDAASAPDPGAAAVAAVAAAAIQDAASAAAAAASAALPAASPASAIALARSASTAAAAASAARGFEWPPSSRLTYQLVGNYRGPVQGHASVEWLHSGGRYQVHLESAVPPLLSRHLTSAGTVGEAGLMPQRFDGEQRTLLQTARHWVITFTSERITLIDGREILTRPGVQDEASQFVQLTWLFTTQPDLLKVGRSIDVPLVLARRLDTWTYQVTNEETLTLPGLGRVPTFHIVSRRQSPASTDAVPEIWIAPTLQCLPVRILLRQGEETWIDLTLDRPPQQAGS
jgi:hypothetical protein